MSRQRFVLLLIAALVAISAALLLNTRRNAPQETQNAALLPSLAGDLASVSAVLVRKGTPTPSLTVHKVGEQWTVAELNDYPADVSKLRRLLISLRDAKTVEEKTSNAARYATLGVEDPSKPGALGTEVTIVAPDGKHAVIVGKSLGGGSFVRRAGEAQSYSVEPAISVESEARFWIDPRLIDVPASAIESIEVKPATGTAYTLHRRKPTDAASKTTDKASKPSGTGSSTGDTAPKPADKTLTDDTFTLDGVPAGRQALDAHLLTPPPTMLTGLTADDVSPVAAIDFAQASQAVITLDDGAVLTLTGALIGTQHWLQVRSTKDAALTAKAQGRAFEVASYRYDGIFRPVEQLLVPKPTPIPKAPPAPKSAVRKTPPSASSPGAASPIASPPSAKNPTASPAS